MPRRNPQPQLAGLKAGKGRACLVTGASGFIGSALIPTLRRAGWRVTATRHTSRQPSASQNGVRWINWRAEESRVPACDWADLDCVIHLAHPRVQSRDVSELPRQLDGGVLATGRLLEEAIRHRVRRFVFVSSGEVIAPVGGLGMEDDCNYAVTGFYGAAKACGEILTRSCAPLISTAVVRVYHPFGPGGDRFLINRMVAAVAAGTEITLERTGGILMNPVWIDDLACGLERAASSGAEGVFHLAGPDTLRFEDFLRLTGQLLGRPPLTRTKRSQPPLNHAGNCRRAHRLLGWRPEIRLAAGLRRMIEALEPVPPGPGDPA